MDIEIMTLRQIKELIEEMRAGISAAHAVLDNLGVRRETEIMNDGIATVIEYPVCDRIKILAESKV